MKRKRIIFTTATLIWVGVIYLFTLQPGDTSGNISESFLVKLVELFPGIFGKTEEISYQTLEKWHYLLRKCAHFTEYMILGILSTEAVRQTQWKRCGLYSFLFCVAIAASDETLQLFVPGRAGRITDVCIDSAGALTGVLIVFGIVAILKRRNSYKKGRQ